MANKNRTSAVKRRSFKIRYFYLDVDGKPELHKILHIRRSQDLMTAWCYSKHKRVGYIYSDVLKHMEKAYSLQEVCKLMRRHRVTIQRDIMRGHIAPPQITYTLDGKETPHKYMFHEKDILGLHDYLLTVSKGRPRADGQVNSRSDIPTRAELMALMRQDIVLYTKSDDGEFRPVFKEPNW